MHFCNNYKKHFIRAGMNSIDHARNYLSGLFSRSSVKNIETISRDAESSNYQGLEQFIGKSPWDHKAVMKQVSQDANSMMGDKEEVGFFIDETSFLKKGKSSVGVKRQWSGRIGKVENCQVGVFGCLGDRKRLALTDFRLFLPEDWAEDEARCKKAKIPIEHCEYKAKWELALDLVKNAVKEELNFGWVGADGLYGNNSKFTNGVEDLGLKFVCDIHCNTKVWTSEPSIEEASVNDQQKEKGGKKRREAKKEQKQEFTRIAQRRKYA